MGSTPVRDSRIFRLRHAASYPESAFLDMVLYFPLTERRPYRMWMLTTAEHPEVAVNHERFQPVARHGDGPFWFDFGTVENLQEIVGPRCFGQLKWFGVTLREAPDSYFVITAQTALTLYGGIDTAEQILWGIRRADVGRTCITPLEVPVGRQTTFLCTYTVGPHGLPADSRIRLSFPGAFSKPQTEQPDRPGYLCVTEAPEPIEIESIDRSKESHEKVDAVFRLPNGLPAGAAVDFSYLTDFTYLFESVYATMERAYWYSHLPPMALAVAVDERRMWVPPLETRGHQVRFVPGPPERVHLFLPGRRREGDQIRLTGILTDKYRNISPTGSPRISLGFNLLLDGPDGTVDLGSSAKHFVARHRFELTLNDLTPGVYRVRAVLNGNGEAVAVSNPLEIMSRDDARSCVYWGEIHGHSEMSDGSGDFEEMLRHARDEAALDFAASADHACYFSDNEWLWMQDVVNSFSKDELFIAIIGYEWAGKQGHRNIYSCRNRLDLFRGMYPPTSSIDVVYRHFEGNADVVAGPHTGHTGDFWDGHNPNVERFIEIYSMWGDFEELVVDLLQSGAVAGFTGGGDCHEGHCFLSVEDAEGQGRTAHTFAAALLYKCGITGAAMPELTRRALLDALRERRTCASTGPRILIDFAVSGIQMGRSGSVDGTVKVEATVHACAPIDRIDIIRDGNLVRNVTSDSLDQTIRWEDADVPGGRHWYFLRVTQQNGERAWSSPVWVEK